MQVLFQSSAEASSTPGIGIIPCPIYRFDDSDKPVPHIGWNSAVCSDNQGSKFYYFVHSYCAKYEPDKYPEASTWIHSTTQYGQEVFISHVKKGSISAVQFHPEKSGEAGLALIDEWLHTHSTTRPTNSIQHPPRLKHHLTKRIIACMDVRANDEGDLVVTKGDQYDVREKATSPQVKTAGAVRNLGKPITLASQYYHAGADEICLLNITSFRHSPLLDQPMLAVVRAAAESVFVPLTIGGGIKDTIEPDGTRRSALEVAGAYFRAGADKVSIGSEAVYAVEKLLSTNTPSVGGGTSAIEMIAHTYGRQAVVVSIDPRRVYVDPSAYQGPYQNEVVYGTSATERGKAWWYQCTVSGGRESRPLSVCQLAKGVEILGAGEILLNSIDRDGTGLGYDLDLLRLVKKSVRIPVIASSGAGGVEDFVRAFEETDVEAALAAGIFHRGEVTIAQVKERLQEVGIHVRR